MRCYFQLDGQIKSVRELTVTSDADAIRQAEALFRARRGPFDGFEIWDRARIVHSYKTTDAGGELSTASMSDTTAP